ncbi:MAG TPA: DUF2237 domain-containing protein [Oxalicibacterium sp.]|jgi:hypothetical protein|nr:DUF2237 domain-containing protein [Oxalicibacterium sp.]
MNSEKAIAKNVFGEPLVPCSFDPLTGFFRDGCCRTSEEDVGQHTVCVVMTATFLAFSKTCGNDLTTPRPEWGFPGLKPGDQWCLCASRWVEAWRAGVAPSVMLESTHRDVLQMVSLDDLREHAYTAQED